MTFNHAAHKRLWDWLSRNPLKRKGDWPEWQKNGGTCLDSENECFACEACGDCFRCPLVWPNGHCYEIVVDGITYNGLFKRWHVLNEISSNRFNRLGFFDLAWESIPEIIQLARRIRDLPLTQHSDQKDITIFFDDREPGDLEPALDDDFEYDRRIDDMLCGDDDDNIIIQWFEED